MAQQPLPHLVPSQGYRKDIDGLRAVAVLGVLAFHLGFASGGYVGVDVFFVISGFLITGLLIDELAAGRFGVPQLARFFERRIRRILPALAVMCLVTLIVSLVLLFPQDLKEYGRSLQAVAIFIANFHFMRKTGYFDGAAEEKPLLHTWSLGVEEQFYLAFPPLLWAVYAWLGRRGAVALCVAVGAASLAYSETLSSQSAAFFSTFSRVWELLVGSLLAMSRTALAAGRPLREILAAAGALLIGYSYVFYSSATSFPGLGAVAPVAGAGLIIAAGIGGQSLVSRLLATGPLVAIGLISYSIYLWHWPLIIFVKYRLGPYYDAHLAEFTALLLAGSLTLGYLSWRFIEQPFRAARGESRQTRVFAAQASATLAMLAVGVVLSQTDGLPQRWPGDVLAILNPGEKSPHRTTCSRRASEDFAEVLVCEGEHTAAAPAKGILLWGDSHAIMLRSSLSAVAGRERTLLSAVSAGCPPILGVVLGGQGRSDRCQKRNERVVAFLRSHPQTVSTVVLAARWPFYAEGTRMPFEPGRGVVLGGGNPADAPRVLREQLEATVAEVSKYVDWIVFVAPLPEFDRPVAVSLARERAWGISTLKSQSWSAVELRQRAALNAIVSAAAVAPEKVRIASPLPYFCNGQACAFADRSGLPLFSDSNHLNQLGLAKIKELLKGIVATPPRVERAATPPS